MSGPRSAGGARTGTAATGATAYPSAARSALSRCIGVDPAVFAQRYWSREPLLTRTPSAGFDDLFDAAAVDELVSRRGLRTPFLRMANRGDVLANARFTRSGGSGAGIADQVADDKVLAELASGSTLVLQALHRTWPPLIEFASALAAELGHPVQINAYITPPQNQGFAAHYDNHDVFVLQVAGAKRWRIHEPVLRDPLPEQNWEQRGDHVRARAAEPALIDTVLETGNALYLPRGYLHSAGALGEVSIHLTVGVHPITRNALLRELIDTTADDPALRTSLPMGVDLADPGVLAPHVAATAQALADFAARIDAGAVRSVAARLGAALAATTRPEPVAPLAQGAAAAALHPRTALRPRAGLRYAVSERGSQVVLSFLDKTLTLPSSAADALLCALTAEQFTPADLPGLDADEQMVLAHRLLREALVVPVTPSPGR
jgi:ribosomal protein L16 Arg81 hydroxylase